MAIKAGLNHIFTIPMNGIGFGRILASEKSVSVCVLSPSLIRSMLIRKRAQKVANS